MSVVNEVVQPGPDGGIPASIHPLTASDGTGWPISFAGDIERRTELGKPGVAASVHPLGE